MTEIDPSDADRRLERLAELYVPETLDEGRLRLDADQRLAAAQAAQREGFDAGASRRLEQLRALCELSKALQTARRL
jgi:hypothetical protein